MKHRKYAPLQLRCCALAVAAAAALCACTQNAYVEPPPPTVTAQRPVVQDVTDYLAYTGRTRAVESVEVQARVKGYLQSMHYTPGSDVKRGDLLFIIDPEPFDVEVAAKKAELSSRKAEAALAQTTFERSRELYRQRATSEIEYLKFKAQLDRSNAAVLAAEAALADAELDLDYAYVKSPIDGRAGRNMIDIGNLVGANETTVLTEVVDYSPLFVYFQISELDVLRVQAQIRARNAKERGGDGDVEVADGPSNAVSAGDPAQSEADVLAEEAAAEVADAAVDTADGEEADADADAGDVAGSDAPQGRPVDAEPEPVEKLTPSQVGYEASGGTRYGRAPSRSVPRVEVGLADEEGYPHEGFLDFADSAIDEATGTLELRGVLANEGDFEDIIMPGSFTRVRVPVGTFQDAMLVPARAVGTDQGGRFLLVAGDGDVVEQRYVEVGGTYQDMQRIVSGIAPDDRVVVNGLQRARPGARVTVEMSDTASGSHQESGSTAGASDRSDSDGSAGGQPPKEPGA